MDILNRDEYLNRTNNQLQSFHNILNLSLDSFHPRIRFLVHRLKYITIKKYEEYKESIKHPKKPEIKKYSLINDIYSFISNYNRKYKSNISAKNIMQSERDR